MAPGDRESNEELLRRYEPILVYSREERFFPMAVEDFARGATLKRAAVISRVPVWPLERLLSRPLRFAPGQAPSWRAIIDKIDQHPRRKQTVDYVEYVDRVEGGGWRRLTWIELGWWLAVLLPLVALALDGYARLVLLGASFAVVAVNILASAVVVNALVEAADLRDQHEHEVLWRRKLSRFVQQVSRPLLDTLAQLPPALPLQRIAEPPAEPAADGAASVPTKARISQHYDIVNLLRLLFVPVLALVPVALALDWRPGDQRDTVIRWVVIGGGLAVILGALYALRKALREGYISLSSLLAVASGLHDGTGEAAWEKAKPHMAPFRDPDDPRRFRAPYYGRVVTDDPPSAASPEYVVLQYWFFYAFNEWRTRYEGIDDHEGDWEHISVVLARDRASGDLKPLYVVYSQHILPGVYLKRAWDDPALVKLERKVGGDVHQHPVAFVASGSHAHYYRPGVHSLESLLRNNALATGVYGSVLRSHQRRGGLPHDDVASRAGTARRGPMDAILASMRLRQKDLRLRPELQSVVADYAAVARGSSGPPRQLTGTVSPADLLDAFPPDDCRHVGPGMDIEWRAEPIDEPNAPDWLRFGGHWGKYVAFVGECAPRGPNFGTKHGEPRTEWADPLAAADVRPPV